MKEASTYYGPLYVEGYKLKEDEYLLKVRPTRYRWKPNEELPTGFLTKLTKKGDIPESFKNWGGRLFESGADVPIYVFQETYDSGWKLDSWRFGQSQNWASLIHPKGFTVEIYLDDFLDVLKTHTVVDGEIVGRFKWEKNKLVEEKC